MWKPNPKPEPWKKVKARRKRERIERRRDCRAQVFARDGGRCIKCRRRLALLLQDAAHEFDVAHIHEVKLRSLGGDPTDPDNCVTLCHECHRDAHERNTRAGFEPATFGAKTQRSTN